MLLKVVKSLSLSAKGFSSVHGGGGFGKKVVKFSSDTPSKEYARARSKDR